MENKRKRLTVKLYLPLLQITLWLWKKKWTQSWYLFDGTYQKTDL